MTKAIDPVCGMSVDSEQAAAREDYQGRTYYFCSGQCHNEFKAHPEKYVATKQGCCGHGGHSHGDD